MSYKMTTKNGKNFWDVASLIQKAVRRADYNRAGYCANELYEKYPFYIWKKFFIISTEDCFGAVTKVMIDLFEKNTPETSKENISKALITLCKCRKSKDGDYFGCNYIHSEQKLNLSKYTDGEMPVNLFGCYERSNSKKSPKGHTLEELRIALTKSILKNDYEYAGYATSELMLTDNDFLWETLIKISIENLNGELTQEINAIYKAQKIYKELEAVFSGKAISLLCQSLKPHKEGYFEVDYEGTPKVIPDEVIENYDIEKCFLPADVFPDWVYSWHTYKGKKMGRDCVDSIIEDQYALTPLQKALFDDYDWGYHISKMLLKHNPKHRPLDYKINWN